MRLNGPLISSDVLLTCGRLPASSIEMGREPRVESQNGDPLLHVPKDVKKVSL